MPQDAAIDIAVAGDAAGPRAFGLDELDRPRPNSRPGAAICECRQHAFREALRQTDLLFCNATEACAVVGAQTAEEAFGKLKGVVPSVVVTDGPNGAFVRHGGVEAHVPAFPCEPVDLTGAGDMLAGAFLYGITHDVEATKAVRAACFLAMKVITQVGARLHHGARQFWEECLASLS